MILGLMVFTISAWMTGARIGELLYQRWEKRQKQKSAKMLQS